jgi:hypothetical protein
VPRIKKDFSIDQSIKLQSGNYCECGIMSRCTAGSSWAKQRLCRFATKSSIGERCMYYRSSFGGHCDCVGAQREYARIMREKCRR